MLAHSFNRFYIVTKFFLPTIKDLKFSTLNFNSNCEYLKESDKKHNADGKQHILDLTTYCRRIRPHVYFYKHQIKSLNDTAHHILKNEVDLILSQFPRNKKEKRGIITFLITGFIGLAYEGISTFLHNRRHKALHKGVKAMETKTDIQHIKHIYLEDTTIMYEFYNAETLIKLINMVHDMHNTKTLPEKLLAGQLTTAYRWYINLQ